MLRGAAGVHSSNLRATKNEITPILVLIEKQVSRKKEASPRAARNEFLLYQYRGYFTGAR